MGVKVVRVKAYFPLKSIYRPVGNQGFVLNVADMIREVIEEKQIDVVHCHGHHYYLTWRTISAAKKLGVPVILTLHGLDALSRCNTIARLGEEIFNRTIFRRELNNLAAVIGLTPHITDYAKKYGILSKKCFSIPNGVDYPVFCANIQKKIIYRQKYGIDLEKTVILFRGRFSQVKGVCELAEAAKQVVEKNHQAFFVFVGDGPLASELTKALQPIRANSKIIGWTPKEKIHELYIASNMFILPSKSEALPLTILEAMAARLNIVATSVGGVPEILDGYPNKTIINDGSPAEISKAILEALRRGNEVSFNEQFIKHGMDNFNWEKIAGQVERIYKHVCCSDLELGLLQNNCFPDSIQNSLFSPNRALS